MTNTTFYSPPLSSIGGSVQAPTYVVFQIGSVIYAQSSAGSGFQAYSGTDAATIINNAITALKTTGGTIFIRAGTYTIQTPIDIEYSNIHVIGEGIDATILQAGSSLSTYSGTLPSMFGVAETTTSVINNVSVENLTVDGSTLSTLPSAISAVLTMDWNGNSNGPSNSLFYRVKVLLFNASNTNGFATSFLTTSGVGNVWRECLVDGTGLSSGSNSVYGYNIEADVVCSQCVAQNMNPGGSPSTVIGFYVPAFAPNLVALIGCEAFNNVKGYLLAAPSVLTGCLARNNQLYGCLAQSNCSIIGGAFINNGQRASGTASDRVGLELAPGQNIYVYGCDCRDTQGTATQQYGISLKGTVSTGKTIVLECSATGNATAPVYVDPTVWTSSGYAGTVILRGINNLTPVGSVSKPFAAGHYTITPRSDNGGVQAAPEASTNYTVRYVPVFVTSTGGTGVSITLKDSAGNAIQSSLSSLTQQYIPDGFMVNFGGFSAGPTVSVWALGD